MTVSIAQLHDNAIPARVDQTSLAVTPADQCLPFHNSQDREPIATQHLPLALPRPFRALSQLLVFLVERGHLRLTTEHAEAWKPMREVWREKQENRDDPDAVEFRSDVARIYDRAVKRAVHTVEIGPAAERQKGKLERYRYDNLPPVTQVAAVDLTIEVLDRLMRNSESLEEANRMEAAKATIQGMVRELADLGFLAITHDFRVAHETWRAKEKSADEDPGDPDKANEEAAAKKALQAAALASCKVAVFAAANSPEPAIRERFRPFKTSRLTTAEIAGSHPKPGTSWSGCCSSRESNTPHHSRGRPAHSPLHRPRLRAPSRILMRVRPKSPWWPIAPSRAPAVEAGGS